MQAGYSTYNNDELRHHRGWRYPHQKLRIISDEQPELLRMAATAVQHRWWPKNQFCWGWFGWLAKWPPPAVSGGMPPIVIACTSTLSGVQLRMGASIIFGTEQGREGQGAPFLSGVFLGSGARELCTWGLTAACSGPSTDRR